MHLDPMMMNITVILSVALATGYLAVRVGLPIVVAYIVSGIMLGPSVLAVMDDQHMASRLGEIGVVMLLFFVGMEIDVSRLFKSWRIAVLGTLGQISITVGVCLILAWVFSVPAALGILFGFVISLSSTAVVVKQLQDAGEMDMPFGRNAIGVLLVQDLAIVPMMIILNLMGNAELSTIDLAKQIIGGLIVVGLVAYLIRSRALHIPEYLKGSLEKRVILGLLLCLGAATLTSWLGLSPGLGAFLAGMVLASSDQSTWVRKHLEPVHVMFVMVFFLSVGMMVSIDYLIDHWLLVAGATLLVFLFNSGVNVFVMRALGETWEQAVITGGLLSQIGEFSFLLAAVGTFAGILSPELRELTVIIIAMTLLFSPVWVKAVKHVARQKGG